MVCRGLPPALDRSGERSSYRRCGAECGIVWRNARGLKSDPGYSSGLTVIAGPHSVLEFVPVRRTSEEPLFNSLLEQYHYLGYAAAGWRASQVPSGKQRASPLRVWLGQAPRCIPAAAIGSSARGVRSAAPRNIHLLAYNTRFLILPSMFL